MSAFADEQSDVPAPDPFLSRVSMPPAPDGVPADWWESHHLPELGADNLGYSRFVIDLQHNGLGTEDPGMAMAIVLSRVQLDPADIVSTFVRTVGPDQTPVSVTVTYLDRPHYQDRFFVIGNEMLAARMVHWRALHDRRQAASRPG